MGYQFGIDDYKYKDSVFMLIGLGCCWNQTINLLCYCYKPVVGL